MSVPNAIKHFRKASIHRPYGMEKRSDAFMLLLLTESVGAGSTMEG